MSTAKAPAAPSDRICEKIYYSVMPSTHKRISCRRQRSRSENRFVCADFWSDKKAAYDKKSVNIFL